MLPVCASCRSFWCLLAAKGGGAQGQGDSVSGVLTSADSASGLDSESLDTSFDDCAAVIGVGAREARYLAAVGSDTVVASETGAVFTDADALRLWMEQAGVVAGGVVERVDFSTEQAVGYISRWGNASYEGKKLASFAWSLDAAGLIGVVAVDEPCEGSDDDLPLVQVWATPQSPVGLCERGVRCSE